MTKETTRCFCLPCDFLRCTDTSCPNSSPNMFQDGDDEDDYYDDADAVAVVPVAG
jgi:hypothetical protein